MNATQTFRVLILALISECAVYQAPASSASNGLVRRVRYSSTTPIIPNNEEKQRRPLLTVDIYVTVSSTTKVMEARSLEVGSLYVGTARFGCLQKCDSEPSQLRLHLLAPPTALSLSFFPFRQAFDFLSLAVSRPFFVQSKAS